MIYPNRPQNALSNLINQQYPQFVDPMIQAAQARPQMQNMLAGLSMGLPQTDVMSPAERNAYYQATGERISAGGDQPQAQPQPATLTDHVEKTIDPLQVAAYMRQRQAQIDAAKAAALAAQNAPKPRRTYYGD